MLQLSKYTNRNGKGGVLLVLSLKNISPWVCIIKTMQQTYGQFANRIWEVWKIAESESVVLIYNIMKTVW